MSLQNFRSYQKQTFNFSPESTLIIGPNTVGKTNLLEAIFFLATGNSFRADQDREAVKWGEKMSNVNCQMSNQDDKFELELRLSTGEYNGQKIPLKKYLVNGIARRAVDFVGNLHAVLFWPEDLELVTDSPNLRRKYLDSVLVQVDREYRRNLLSYERGLRQRNRLLDLIFEGKAHRHQLEFWNELLIRAGGYLTDKRAEFIEFINNFRSTINHYQLFYDKSVISGSRIDQYKEEEVLAGATLVGPHRDNIIFKLNGMELGKYGSRGEQRLAVLWLKLAELDFLEEKTGERPILLLDDIFSELDEKHRDLVFKMVGAQQSILTSADESVLTHFKKALKAEVIHLKARK